MSLNDEEQEMKVEYQRSQQEYQLKCKYDENSMYKDRPSRCIKFRVAIETKQLTNENQQNTHIVLLQQQGALSDFQAFAAAFSIRCEVPSA